MLEGIAAVVLLFGMFYAAAHATNWAWSGMGISARVFRRTVLWAAVCGGATGVARDWSGSVDRVPPAGFLALTVLFAGLALHLISLVASAVGMAVYLAWRAAVHTSGAPDRALLAVRGAILFLAPGVLLAPLFIHIHRESRSPWSEGPAATLFLASLPVLALACYAASTLLVDHLLRPVSHAVAEIGSWDRRRVRSAAAWYGAGLVVFYAAAVAASLGVFELPFPPRR